MLFCSFEDLPQHALKLRIFGNCLGVDHTGIESSLWRNGHMN
jgi:hypothetical protein